MSQYFDSGLRPGVAAAAMAEFLRVHFDGSGTVTVSDASTQHDGTNEFKVFAAGDGCTVRLNTAPGTRKMVASAAFAVGATVYAAAGGKVAGSGTIVVGKALEAAAADGQVVEVVPKVNSDVSTAITGTTAATFEADNDLGKPRAALGSQTGGTGDFKAVIKPPTTLTADRNFTLVGDAATNLVGDDTVQTLTNKTLSTATKDLRDTITLTPDAVSGAAATMTAGKTQYTVGAVTNDANDWINLPAIASVSIGHTIVIACNAGTNFELRTPATSNTKINDVDSDGSQEYLCTDTDLIVIRKQTTTGWNAQSFTKLGALRTAVIPD